MRRQRVIQIALVAIVGLGPISGFDTDPLFLEGEASQRRDPDPAPPKAEIVQVVSHDTGRRLRGDWEPPDVLLLAFTELWPDTLADLIAIAGEETQVRLIADPTLYNEDTVEQWAEGLHLPTDSLRVIWLRIDTAWVRDYGPFEVREASGERVWLDADYAPPRPHDDAVPPALATLFGVRSVTSRAPLDGGAVISNGQGLCVMTREYLLENEIDLEDAGVRNDLLDELGCRVLVAVPALADERTRHADMLAQFLSPDVVAVADVSRLESPGDAAGMDEAARAIEEGGRRLGLALRVARVPLPYLGEGKYRTYLNGVRLLSALVVPSYRDVPDGVEDQAYRALSEALPGTNVVAVPADDVIQLLGSLHCITLGLNPPVGRIEAAGAPLAGPSRCDAD